MNPRKKRHATTISKTNGEKESSSGAAASCFSEDTKNPELNLNANAVVDGATRVLLLLLPTTIVVGTIPVVVTVDVDVAAAVKPSMSCKSLQSLLLGL
jgi:hypothetical protein